MSSMIETYRKCKKLTNGEKVQKCFWFYFFNEQTSIKRLHAYKVFERRFGSPNDKFKEFIEEWYKKDNTISPLLYYGMNYL